MAFITDWMFQLMVRVVGSCGGLTLAWNGNNLIQVYSYLNNHIDVEINEEDNTNKWRFTRFYGNPSQSNKHESWNLLRRLKNTCLLSWCVCEDFKEIMYAHEKIGRATKDKRQMEKFCKALEECDLADMGFSGQKCTWERGNFTDTNIRERLDRGVTNLEWLNLFTYYLVQHLSQSFSDHCPIFIQTVPNVKRSGSNHFKFEPWWINEPSCEEIIKKLWSEKSGKVLDKLEHIRVGLQRWGKNIKRDRERKSKNLRERLVELDGMDRDDDTLADIIDVKLELNWEMEKEEMYWEQRARANWLRQRDKNTAFFFIAKINKIQGLEDIDCILKTEEKDMEEIIRDYFMKLFQSSGVGDTNHLLSGANRSINENMNQLLIANYKEEEITKALNNIGSTKASRPDGFPAIFFHKFWHIVGREVSGFSLEVLNKVFYKIISKTIANIFQKVLDYCIDLDQNAFVPGRLITDNVLLAYEILHSMRNKKVGKKGLMALKIDMSKAYDQVE
ncbi:reverse transcriptase [Gossypium australe]|uniref:Reverse transcriptase n=1 Tax=Gossypium australe TaxID=47621 RepID=A0A5B6VV15_9ROSI|nr:reverse transcriptase [Gossypium australe]